MKGLGKVFEVALGVCVIAVMAAFFLPQFQGNQNQRILPENSTDAVSSFDGRKIQEPLHRVKKFDDKGRADIDKFNRNF